MRPPILLRLLTMAALAVAFTAFSLVAAAVQHERVYNASVDPREEVYQVFTRVGRSGQEPVVMATGLTDLAPALEAVDGDFVVARVARDIDPRALEIDGSIYWVSITEVDPSLVEVLDFGEARSGFEQALVRPDAMVITRSLARELFNDRGAVGQVVRIGAEAYSVSAVTPDIDENSSFSGDRAFISTLGPASSLRLADAATAGLTFSIGGAITLVRSPHPEVFARVREVADRHGSAAVGRFMASNPGAGGVGLQISHHLVPIRDLEQATALGASRDGSRLDRGALTLLVGVALVVVLVASLNAASLTLTQTLARAPTIAVRRAFGASRSHIARKVVGQALISALAAALAGLTAAFVLSEAFGALINRPLPRVPDLATLIAVLATACASGLIAGGYAAWITTRMRPRDVLSARDVKLPGMSWIPPMLVGLQIAGSASALVFAAAVTLQLSHLTGTTLGFNPEGLSAYRLPEPVSASDPRRASLLAQAHQAVNESALAYAAALPTEGVLSRRTVSRGGQSAEVTVASWLPESLEVFGVTLLAGALPFSYKNAQDAVGAKVQPVVLSATAARRLGFAMPSDAVGALLATDSPGVTWRVSAVMADMPLGQLRGGDGASVLVDDGGPARFLVTRASAFAALDAMILKTFPGAPVDRIALGDQVNIAFADLIRLRGLILVFSAVLTATTAVGVLAMTLDCARRMRKEAAVRRAFGARAFAIGKLLAGRIYTPIGIGYLVGASAGVLSARIWLAAYPEKTAFVAPGIAAAAVILGAATSLAAAAEIWRLSRTRPVEALRED